MQLTLTPIGVIHTPFTERARAPRQSVVARDVEGTLVLEPGRDFEHALSDVSAWEFLWVVYWFHRNVGWRPKVLPPRSRVRRGVFSTRSPHRPNPIGLSVVKLVRIEGLHVHVRGVDMLDGSPLLDLKPYVPYADALPAASGGWLADEVDEAKLDPGPRYEVSWEPLALAQLAWLGERGVDLASQVESTLRLGPQPHPYRRIRASDDGMRLAIKAWRVSFRVDGRRIVVEAIASGYRPRELATGEAQGLEVHRDFAGRFGRG